MEFVQSAVAEGTILFAVPYWCGSCSMAALLSPVQKIVIGEVAQPGGFHAPHLVQAGRGLSIQTFFNRFVPRYLSTWPYFHQSDHVPGLLFPNIFGHKVILFAP